VHDDRLTARTAEEIEGLLDAPAAALTLNELLALAAQRIAEKNDEIAVAREGGTDDYDRFRDAGRDLSIAYTALEDAATRYNSACYRIADTWKRADPDR
jgi:hypothetical protein